MRHDGGNSCGTFPTWVNMMTAASATTPMLPETWLLEDEEDVSSAMFATFTYFTSHLTDPKSAWASRLGIVTQHDLFASHSNCKFVWGDMRRCWWRSAYCNLQPPRVPFLSRYLIYYLTDPIIGSWLRIPITLPHQLWVIDRTFYVNSNAFAR